MRKRIVDMLVCLSLASVCFAGCGNITEEMVETKNQKESVSESSDEPSNGSGVVNPITEVDSLEELNQKAGSNFFKTDESVEDEKFLLISNSENETAPIAEYDYTRKGVDYMVRYCRDITLGGISGIYSGDGVLFNDPLTDEFKNFAYTEADDSWVAHWCTIDGQYIFAVMDKTNMTESEFSEAAKAYMDGSIPKDGD